MLRPFKLSELEVLRAKGHVISRLRDRNLLGHRVVSTCPGNTLALDSLLLWHLDNRKVLVDGLVPHLLVHPVDLLMQPLRLESHVILDIQIGNLDFAAIGHSWNGVLIVRRLHAYRHFSVHLRARSLREGKSIPERDERLSGLVYVLVQDGLSGSRVIHLASFVDLGHFELVEHLQWQATTL